MKSARNIYFYTFAVLFLSLFFTSYADAATLSISPNTGVYSVNGIFTARVVINTGGQSVNAAEGQLSFNPRELAVVNVSRASSIFNLWTQEPSFSNAGGTITFGGGSPSGYRGSAGTVMTITFRALNAGTPKLTFTKGSVLAADGLGTNILTSMNGASYTVSAPLLNPEPEYIAPANTPHAPQVTSSSHPDPEGWYQTSTAALSWALPDDIIAVRTLLDEQRGTIPTIVYDEPIISRAIEDLPNGVSYFHIQFKNNEGWGKVTHYRIGVDTEAPSAFTISEDETQDVTDPEKKLVFTVEDISPVRRYMIQIDAGEAFEYIDEEGNGHYTLPRLEPGHHTVIVEAFDAAQNSRVATYSFDIASFDRPVFTEYPTRINTEVIPVIKGTTRPRAMLTITVLSTRGAEETHSVVSDQDGSFIFIPENTFAQGVYDIMAVAIDEFGAQSEPSQPIRIVVEAPGYIKVGSFVVSVLSVVVPFVALLLLLVFGVWYLWHRLLRWQRYVRKETKEAERRLAVEFDTITSHLSEQVEKLKKSRKGKLTKAETELINGIKKDVDNARNRIRKEISDIDDVVE